jgi:putative nucleotidyltransferase with HDIG domain
MRSIFDTTARDDRPDTQQRLDESRKRLRVPLPPDERRLEGLAALAFASVVGVIAAAQHHAPQFHVTSFALVVLVAVVAGRATLPVASGFTTPMALADVPALFLLPPVAVPAAIALSYLIARGLDARAGRLAANRVWLGIPHATPTLAAALVFALAAPGAPDGADWPVYVLAMGAQLLLDGAAGALRAKLLDGQGALAFFRETTWVYALDAALWPVGLAFAFACSGGPVGLLLALPLLAVFSSFARDRRAGIDRLLELSAAYRGTALLLGNVIEEDDVYTGSHSKGVLELAVEVADTLGLDAPERRRVEFGALLHDVGKIAIPKQIINKPGSLDDHEWTVMKTHTVEGQRMLEQVGGLMGEVGAVVRGSHERWDGKGYPDGLAGEQILLESRIVCCCDAFSAMTTDRPYRQAMPVADALHELRRCSGTQFDPAVVTAVVAVVERAEGIDRSADALLPSPALQDLPAVRGE